MPRSPGCSYHYCYPCLAANAYADKEVDSENPAVSSVLAIQEQMHQYAIAGDGRSFGGLISADFVASDPPKKTRFDIATKSWRSCPVVA